MDQVSTLFFSNFGLDNGVNFINSVYLENLKGSTSFTVEWIEDLLFNTYL